MLRSLRRRLESQVESTGLRLDVIQQDYLLTWLLKGISSNSVLRDSLVFKGGTALKKCFFGQYRFSEDLDFTATKLTPTGEALQNTIEDVCNQVVKEIHEYAPVRLICEPYSERRSHPHGQEAFAVRAQFPWQREPLTKVMIEITTQEILVLPPVSQPLIHAYEEPIRSNILVYSLEEIVLEKLRAILQHTQKLHERHWSRSRARDYYDLWQILCQSQFSLNIAHCKDLLQKKCAIKNVSFAGLTDFFSSLTIEHVTRTWDEWLGPLVMYQPPVEQVIDELRSSLQTVLAL